MFKPVTFALLALMLVGGVPTVRGESRDPAASSEKPDRDAGGENRGDLIDGWLMMAEAIGSVARDLDVPIPEEVFDLNSFDRKRLEPALNGLVRRSRAVAVRNENSAADLNLAKTALARARAELFAERSRREKESANYRNRLSTARREKAELENELARAKAELERLEHRLSVERNARTKTERELARIRTDYKKLTAEEHGLTAIWADGSPEARAHIKGRVVKVDQKQGFLVTDIGTGTRAIQRIGAREVGIDPQFRRGMELIVCRENGGKLKFIARIRIESIDENCSLANIPAEAGKAIREGDVVIWNSR